MKSKFYSLGDEAKEYLLANLNYPDSFFRSKIKNSLKNKEYSFSTLFPESIDIKALLTPQKGNVTKIDTGTIKDLGDGFQMHKVSTTIKEFAIYLAEYLEKAGNLIIIEHPLGKSGDPWVKKNEVKKFFFEEQVYFYLSENDDQSKIEEVLKTTSSFRPVSLGIFTKGQSLEKFNGKEIDQAEFERLITNQVKFYTDAYDGESFIVAERD